MYIIDLKGLESANLQVNGCTLVLKNGQEVSEVIAKAIPKYIVEVKGSVESKEEILTEVSGPVEVEISEDSIEVTEEVKIRKPRK